MLRRELSFLQATAINMIDMVGIGPFVTTALVAATMGSAPMALLAWCVGMSLALVDASVWSELGAKMPEAGGSYTFLREAYGRDTWGRLMAFLFVWQTSFQAPLVVTSGALGFAKYLAFVTGPLDPLFSKLCGVTVIIVLVALLYRRIGDVGKISVVLWACVVTALLWIIGAGFYYGSFAQITSGAFVQGAVGNDAIWAALGIATIPTIYSYLGYYNVCHLGAEVKDPVRVIPRSMYISIIGIGVLYLAMQTAIYAVLPVGEVASSPFVVSTLINTVQGPLAAQVVTGLVLIVAVASLFSVLLGYTRIPYAAAKDGLFFSVFAREHPTKNFPHIALLALGGIAIVFTMTLELGDAIKSIITMRVFTQFVAQAIGLIMLRRRVGAGAMPWRMWLYPLPVLLTIVGWIWIFSSAKPLQQILGVVAPLVGVVVYLALAGRNRTWPFRLASRE
ncbi:MAG: amino acid permease [Candidatus Kapabacteria bacterium]|nr:amino acid permease [Candidatus Kapabacteria bacterium]